MRSAVLTLLVVLLSASHRAEGVPNALDQAKIDRAIERGVAWLTSIQKADGSFPLNGVGNEADTWAGGPWHKGANALAVYALAACDVPADAPALVRGFRHLKELWTTRLRPKSGLDAMSNGDGITTYFVSLCLLALDARENRRVAELADGPARGRAGKRLSKEDRTWVRALTTWLRDAQDQGKGARRALGPRGVSVTPRGLLPDDDGGGFGYVSPRGAIGYHDHSNSQFALLGLKAAARLGVEVPRDVWLRSLRHFLVAQEKRGPMVPRVPADHARGPTSGRARRDTVTTADRDEARGWSYLCEDTSIPEGFARPAGQRKDLLPATASMTAGGVSTLVICRSELIGKTVYTKDLARRTEEGIRGGLAWLSVRLERMVNPPRAAGAVGMRAVLELGGGLDDFYFLYGLERACVLGGVPKIGAMDWYRTGTRRLLSRQREDGSFKSKHNNGGGDGVPVIDTSFALLFLKKAVFRVPARLPSATPTTPVSFEGLFARYLAAAPAARNGLHPEFVRIGINVLPKLILRLSSSDRETRGAAGAILRATTGESFGFDPDGTPESRREAVVAWEVWWLGNRGRLVADPTAGRFRAK